MACFQISEGKPCMSSILCRLVGRNGWYWTTGIWSYHRQRRHSRATCIHCWRGIQEPCLDGSQNASSGCACARVSEWCDHSKCLFGRWFLEANLGFLGFAMLLVPLLCGTKQWSAVYSLRAYQVVLARSLLVVKTTHGHHSPPFKWADDSCDRTFFPSKFPWMI